MTRQLIVSEVARLLERRPRDISDLFYQRRLDDRTCPVVGGRRLIPECYLPTIKAALEEAARSGDNTRRSKR